MQFLQPLPLPCIRIECFFKGCHFLFKAHAVTFIQAEVYQHFYGPE